MRGVPTVAWRGPAWAPALALALALAVVSCSAQSSNGGGAVSTTDSTIGLLFHRLTVGTHPLHCSSLAMLLLLTRRPSFAITLVLFGCGGFRSRSITCSAPLVLCAHCCLRIG